MALVAKHPALAAVIAPDGDVPSVYACYPFTAKLRDHGALLDPCIAPVIASVKAEMPDLGENVAIDSSDMPTYANGQRFVSKGGRQRSDEKFSDADASWGHRSAVSTRKGGGFYGYRLHMAVDTATDLPLAWSVETAKANESTMVALLLDKLSGLDIRPETCGMDKGYDIERVYSECAEHGVSPVIPLRETTAVRAASTASGDSPEPTTSARQPSGAARPASASQRRCGSRLTGCTRSCRARRCAGVACTSAAEPSSGSSAGSRTNGRSRRCASVASSVCGYTPT